MWEQFTEAFTELFFEEFIPFFTFGVIRGFFIFIIALSIVYLFGRMLGFLKTYRQKNTLAVLVMIIADYWILTLFDIRVDFLFDFIIYLSFAILWYVLLGFTLYSRADKFLDKKIAED